MIRKRVQARRDSDGRYDPRVTIVVEGFHDVYRLARHLERGQSEFARLGRRILRSMDEQEPGLVAALTKQMGPSVNYGYRGRRRRPVQLRLGMPEAELRQLEESVR